MIRGIHAIFYTDQAEELRAFLRDKLELPFGDAGDGWLIFRLGEGELGVHPTNFPGSPPVGTHQLSFYCDDIEATVARLRRNGVEFTDEIADHGYGLVIHFEMPGGVRAELYQPKYQLDVQGGA